MALASAEYTDRETETRSCDNLEELAIKEREDENCLAVIDMFRTREDDTDFVWDGLRRMFGCDICSFSTKKKYLLLKHLKTHSKDQPHKNKTSNTENINDKDIDQGVSADDSLVINDKKHSKTDGSHDVDGNDLQRSRFSCNECSYNTDKRYLLSRHSKTHTGARPYECKICERGFTTSSSLQAHMNVHYGVKDQVCKYCGQTFRTSGNLSRHVKCKHTLEKTHKCTDCSYATVERSKLTRHMRCHTGERPYQCEHCSYASQDRYKLTRHMRTHTGEKPYKCDLCNMCFTQSNSLKFHKLSHSTSEEKLYSCEFCTVKKRRKSELRMHIKRMHFSNKAWECKKCGEIFSDLYSYKLHNKTHQRDKYFKCQLCPFFAAKKFALLKTHMMMHTEHKPFHCDQCNQSFISNSFLRRHQYQCHNKTYILKEKVYECQKCKRAFAYKACLIRHEVVHDKEPVNQQQ